MKQKKSLCLLLTLLLVVGLVLTGCGGQNAQAPQGNSGQDAAATGERVLNIYSWSDNFSPEVLDDFAKKFNCKVNYDVFSSNEELLAKVQAGGAQYDLIQPSDYMVGTMVKLGLLEELNHNNLPNLKNLVSSFQTPTFDAGNKHSVVYTWGVTGIAYNTKYVKDPITSWQDLWNPKYKGRLVLLNDSREMLGMALKKNGFSNSTKNEKEIEKAYNDLKTLAPNVLAYDTEDIKQKFITEEAWIGTVWSGDAAFVYKDNKDVAFIIPKEGTTVWADTLAIPKGAKHRELAEQFINYLMEPEVSVKNYEFIGYSNPNEKAFALHSQDYQKNPMINLSKSEIGKGEWIQDVGDTLKIYDRFWTELKAGQ
ncbi:extracellular solute-binding protein [Heliobacterium gestii]|uniref:Extracellular solute-binding protein n=2 Tax=Heliomicrobium gestii TaxID=2699 RepID=A0A845L9U1_HELGE|nr:extracellular solute-binding protein [Heliomicrobium gestii]